MDGEIKYARVARSVLFRETRALVAKQRNLEMIIPELAFKIQRFILIDINALLHWLAAIERGSFFLLPVIIVTAIASGLVIVDSDTFSVRELCIFTVRNRCQLNLIVL